MIPHWMRRNWGLKIISFVLAVGLWYYAVGEESIEVTRIIPLRIEVENPQMTISERSVRALQVTLSAPRSLIVNLASQDIQAIHKIGSEVKTAGEYSFRIEPGEIRVPSFQIRVLDIEPEAVTVKLDEIIVQKLEIQPDFVGEPAVGYKILANDVRMDPNAILAKGPKGELEKMKFAKTEPIDLVGRIRSFHRTVQVRLPATVRAMSESLVDVYIPIREEFDEKEFKDISVRVLKGSEANGIVELEPSKVSLVLKGSKRALEQLAPETLLAYVDLANLEKGDHEIPLQVVLPEALALKDKQPITIKVAIRGLKD
ncbi:MAG TPA: CdaR family protein [Candidatus Omnitrophota bacterium]|nr:CdaR family protein [Candidatus Omnitrophota bacterium]HPS37220.1 CdaR family protein [Candidatus Omnitrophota bacterium]